MSYPRLTSKYKSRKRRMKSTQSPRRRRSILERFQTTSLTNGMVLWLSHLKWCQRCPQASSKMIATRLLSIHRWKRWMNAGSRLIERYLNRTKANYWARTPYWSSTLPTIKTCSALTFKSLRLIKICAEDPQSGINPRINKNLPL